MLYKRVRSQLALAGGAIIILPWLNHGRTMRARRNKYSSKKRNEVQRQVSGQSYDRGERGRALGLLGSSLLSSGLGGLGLNRSKRFANRSVSLMFRRPSGAARESRRDADAFNACTRRPRHYRCPMVAAPPNASPGTGCISSGCSVNATYLPSWQRASLPWRLLRRRSS